MKKIFLVGLNAFVLLWGGLLSAQNSISGVVKGKVVDEGQAGLPYSVVILRHSADSSVCKTGLSDSLGGYFFDDLKEGGYFLEVNMMGYEGSIKSGLMLDGWHRVVDMGILTMKASTTLLGGVTIKAETPLVERRIDRTVVHVDQLIGSSGGTVMEMMQKLPGVQMTSDGQVTLNGRSGVTVFMDGKPTYLSGGDLASLLDGMGGASVQQIEIMTNPSAKYDAAGTGGIINIVKKRNRKAGLNGNVHGSFGEEYYGRYSGGVGLSYKNERFNLYLNVGYSYHKSLFNRAVSTDVLEGNSFLLTEQRSNTNNIRGEGTFNPSMGMDIYLSPRTTLSVSGNLSTSVWNDATYSSMSILNGALMQTGGEHFTSVRTDAPIHYTGGVHLGHQLDTLGREISFDLDYSNYFMHPMQINNAVFSDAIGRFIVASDTYLDQSRSLGIYGIKVDYMHPLHGSGKVEVGLKFSYVRTTNENREYNLMGGQQLIDSAQSNTFVNTENINAGYINFNQRYKKWSVQAGLRLEQTITKGEQTLAGVGISQNYFQLFPSVFVDYAKDDQNGFNLKLGKRTYRANYSEMIPFRRPLTPTLYFQGNPNLKPELTYHGEVSYTYHKTLTIGLGYDISQDFIRTLPNLDSNHMTVTRIPINIQGARSWNVDLSYSGKVVKWWTLEYSLSMYQNSFTGTTNGFSLENGGIPSLSFNGGNSFRINEQLSGECSFEYQSKRQFVGSSFGAYSILNVGLKQTLFGGKGSVSLYANNILDGESHDAIDRYLNLFQNSYWRFYTRSFRLSFGYRFGGGKVLKSKGGEGALEEQKRAG